MSDKRAFLIVGEANSGNRMMRKAFMAAGCHGNTERGLQVEDLQHDTLPHRIVLARSIPNGDEVPDLKELSRACELAGYVVTPVLIYRKSEFALAGHVEHYNLTEAEAREYRDLATRLAYELAAWLGTTLIVVPYEPFVTDPLVRAHLFTSLGLTSPGMEFFNANEKYELTGSPLTYTLLAATIPSALQFLTTIGGCLGC